MAIFLLSQFTIVKMKSQIKVLWLPGWYPARLDFLPGDFIDRHAKAVSLFANVVVLFVTKDTSLQNNKNCIEVETNKNLIIYRGYYNCSNKFGSLGKLWSVFLYYFLLFKLYKTAKKKHGQFDLVHVHISLRQGLLALWLKWKMRIPYLITEHNSWFMPVGDKFYTNSRLLKKCIKNIFKKASAVHTVSGCLGNELRKKFTFIKSFKVIPNVVDTTVFYHSSSVSTWVTTSFFAITGDIYHKNTDGVVRAFSNYIKKGYSGKLHIAGPDTGVLKLLIETLALKDDVILHGTLPSAQIAWLMQQTDALVFFTRYETFGCVMAEALCCGKPVIATKIPVLEENLEEYKNALFVLPENEDDLTEKLIFFTHNKNLFMEEIISATAAAKYNYKKIGNDFLELYNFVLNKK